MTDKLIKGLESLNIDHNEPIKNVQKKKSTRRKPKKSVVKSDGIVPWTKVNGHWYFLGQVSFSWSKLEDTKIDPFRGGRNPNESAKQTASRETDEESSHALKFENVHDRFDGSLDNLFYVQCSFKPKQLLDLVGFYDTNRQNPKIGKECAECFGIVWIEFNDQLLENAKKDQQLFVDVSGKKYRIAKQFVDMINDPKVSSVRDNAPCFEFQEHVGEFKSLVAVHSSSGLVNCDMDDDDSWRQSKYQLKHENIQKPDLGVCWDFQRGNCRKGDRCKYSHTMDQAQPATKNTGRKHKQQRKNRKPKNN
jgi:hypothetical protein